MKVHIPVSGVPGILIPGMPDRGAAERLALLYQLDRAQWWMGPTIEQAQSLQLGALCSHLWEQVPYYRERLAQTGWCCGEPMPLESYRRLPVMSRSEAMEAGDKLCAKRLPDGHGETTDGSTSGSTGRSLTYWKTAVFKRLELAYHLHHYQNMGWDFSLDLSSILVDRERIARPPDGRTYPDWGPCVQGVYATGAHHFLGARADILEQLAWLQASRPAYLQTYPSNLAALLDIAARDGVDLSFIRGITTQGEQVPTAVRAQVVEFFCLAAT